MIKTVIHKLEPQSFDKSQLKDACNILRKGGLVAFPTETVYGLGADALNPEASKAIYAAKGRPSDNPLIVHIADIKDLYNIAFEVPEKAKKLAKAFWPGALTMIFRKKDIVPYTTTGGLDTVAVRMPQNAVARTLIQESGVYVAAPSANLSGRPSPTKAEHVIEDLSGRIDMIIDGGSVGIGLESTIVDMSGDIPIILRPGYITKDMLEAEIGDVMLDAAIKDKVMREDIKPKAPGMKYRHYAPKGQLLIVEGQKDEVINKINSLVSEKERMGLRAAVIAADDTKKYYKCDIIKSAGSRECDGSIASGIYSILREMDKEGAEYIYTESFEDDRLGSAIMNRMLKAAAYNIIRI